MDKTKTGVGGPIIHAVTLRGHLSLRACSAQRTELRSNTTSSFAATRVCQPKQLRRLKRAVNVLLRLVQIGTVHTLRCDL